jgi:energy-coupling factor transporter ATP-binding protein EcfA2
VVVGQAANVTFTYPDAETPALDDVSLTIDSGELVGLFGRSGSGKSTLLRAFAGLVPHFHGGRFEGRVEVAGRDTRTTPPAELAGTVATVFQDPEQIVLTHVAREVAFGLENLGTAPEEILARARDALAEVGVVHLSDRSVTEISSGELQRVCLASALALQPSLLLLDEPTSQLDPQAAAEFLELVAGLGVAALIIEQRPQRVLPHIDRAVLLDHGRLSENTPDWPDPPANHVVAQTGRVACKFRDVDFAYESGPPVVDGLDLELRRGEVVVLRGPNGTGKTTIAKLVAGLLEPVGGNVTRSGRTAMLLQDPGRYTVRERVDEEVALGVGGDRGRARRTLAEVGLAGFERRHPRDLSSGERERLALASVLVTEPDILVLDEPTRGVDPPRKAELAELVRRDAAKRTTLVVTHDEDFAAAVGDRTITLGREVVVV